MDTEQIQLNLTLTGQKIAQLVGHHVYNSARMKLMTASEQKSSIYISEVLQTFQTLLHPKIILGMIHVICTPYRQNMRFSSWTTLDFYRYLISTKTTVPFPANSFLPLILNYIRSSLQQQSQPFKLPQSTQQDSVTHASLTPTFPNFFPAMILSVRNHIPTKGLGAC